jgi:transcriptional regulator with XRE-family HTH domain
MHAALALADLRESRGITQTQLAEVLAVTQENVSRLERGQDIYLSTLQRYIEGLGGHLELKAVFPDQTVDLVLPSV